MVKNDTDIKIPNIPKRPKLDEQELKVLKYLAMGYNRREIMEAIDVDIWQIVWLFQKLRDKFNAKTVAQVVHLAHMNGYFKERGKYVILR